MDMKIAPRANAQDLWEVNEDIASTCLLYAYEGEETPVPWDASIEVQGNTVILEGSIIGGSSNTPDTAGYCLCKISVDKFSKIYYIEVPAEYLSNQEDIDTLEAGGWSIVK